MPAKNSQYLGISISCCNPVDLDRMRTIGAAEQPSRIKAHLSSWTTAVVVGIAFLSVRWTVLAGKSPSSVECTASPWLLLGLFCKLKSLAVGNNAEYEELEIVAPHR